MEGNERKQMNDDEREDGRTQENNNIVETEQEENKIQTEQTLDSDDLDTLKQLFELELGPVEPTIEFKPDNTEQCLDLRADTTEKLNELQLEPRGETHLETRENIEKPWITHQVEKLHKIQGSNNVNCTYEGEVVHNSLSSEDAVEEVKSTLTFSNLEMADESDSEEELESTWANEKAADEANAENRHISVLKQLNGKIIK